MRTLRRGSSQITLGRTCSIISGSLSGEITLCTGFSSTPSVGRSVGRSVCVYLSVRKVLYCGKRAEWIQVPFWVVSGVDHGMGILEGVHVPQGEGREVSRVFHFHNFWGMNRHFQFKRAKYLNFNIIETTAWIPGKFCTPIKTTKYVSWVVQKRGKEIQMADSGIFGVWLSSGSGTPI